MCTGVISSRDGCEHDAVLKVFKLSIISRLVLVLVYEMVDGSARRTPGPLISRNELIKVSR